MIAHIQKRIAESGLSPETVAKALYPGNKYPEAAYKRLLKGESKLEADQVLALARLLGTSTDSLLRPDSWKMVPGQSRLVFTKGRFSATLLTDKWLVRLEKAGELVIEWQIVKPTISLESFINNLNELTNDN